MTKVKLFSSTVIAGSFLMAASIAKAETGRYSMTPTKDGILRLDTKTGEVALCSRASGRLKCQGVEGQSGSLQDRIRRLELENENLRTQLDAARLTPAPRDGGKLDVPTEEDVDKAMDFMEKLLHRFKGMVDDLKKDKKNEEGVPL
ncbi:MAG: hypothetical protein GY927_14865 [bacterium]|nr:hypothetical protein [bacterium]